MSRRDDFKVVAEAMRLSGSETIGDLVEAFRAHGVRNADELVAKIKGEAG